ncbi:MAG: hypothetical protein N3A66_00220 [Planctomycetota bacterium]|nr:hypothetical protein [Planctomycetota bacterium]
MSEIFTALLALYQIDSEMLKHRKRLQALPEEIAQREKEVNLAREQRQAVESAIQERTRRLDEYNLDIRSHTDELRDLEEKLRMVKNNKEYRILSDRIRELKQTISELETAALLLMEEIDNLRREMVAKQAIVAEQEQRVEEAKKLCQEEAERIRQELLNNKKRREEAIAKVKALNDGAMEVYENAYRRTHGDAMAALANGICQSCFQKQSPNVENMVLVAREIKKCRCAGCGRILYIKPHTA